MPTVPIRPYRTAETFQAASAPNFGALRQNTSGQEMVRDLAQIGDQVQQALGDIDKANLINFSNGLMQSKQTLLNDPDSGFLGKQNLDAINGQAQIQQDWDKSVADAMQGLPKHLQQRAQQIAAEQTLNFTGDVDRHVRTQAQNYQDTVDTNALSAAQNEALLNFGDAGRVDQQADAAAAVAGMQAKRKGLPAGLAEQQARSGIYQVVLQRQAQNDPVGAQQRYYELLESGALTGQAAAQLDQVIRPIVQDQRGRSAADAINNGGTVDLGANPAAIDDWIVGAESGGQADAKNPNSSATGAGQFIDSTWLEQVKKNRPDLADGKSDEEILALRLDKKLSREMVATYRADNTERLRAAGVPASAANVYASHYFGPAGGVAFAKADAATPMSKILGADQLAANPNLQGKTKAEVLAGWQARGLPEAGGVISYSAPAQSEAEALARANQIQDPTLRQDTMQQLRLQWSIRNAQDAYAAQERSESVRQAIADSATSGQTLAQILGPQAYADIVRSGKVGEWQDFRQKVAAGYAIQDNPALVEELSRQAVTDPDAFVKRDISALANSLGTDTLGTLLKKQEDIRSNGAKAVQDYMSEEDRLNYGFSMLGIGKELDASGGGSESKNAPRDHLRGQFRLAYQGALATFMQANGGKKPTPEQADTLLRAAAKRFAQRQADGSLGVKMDDDNLKFTNPKQPSGLYSRAAQYQAQVSQADRDAVRSAYAAKYGRTPTDAWITQYIAQKQLQRQQGAAQ